MLEAADKLAAASPRIAVFDRKRKIELAMKLQQRWQRWELTNFDYLMQVCICEHVSVASCHCNHTAGHLKTTSAYWLKYHKTRESFGWAVHSRNP